jgi:hypothetical protein
MVLTGIQLLTSWLLIVVLAELSKRETRVEQDLNDAPLLTIGEKEEVGIVEVVASI